jgi:predicted metal-binding protein
MKKQSTDAYKSIKNSFEAVARKWGVDIYPLDVKKIKPIQSVRLKCQIPLCEYFEVCKVCPPHIPGVAEFREALQSYGNAFLVVLREKIKNIEVYRKDFSAELKLVEIVSDLELSAFQHGFYNTIEPCRHPFKARPSPEGFGIDITELAREVGVPVEWPPKEYVSFLGLVLV